MNVRMNPIHRAVRRDEGNELLEFALVAPLLLVLLAGAAEFGRAFYTYHILTKSVRNAARYLSASQMSPTGALANVYPNDFIDRAKNLAVFGNTDGGGSAVLPDLGTSHISIPTTATQRTASGQYYVTVTANYTYTPMFDFVLPSVNFTPKETMVFVGYIAGS